MVVSLHKVPARENNKDDANASPPQDEDGNYICGRKCKDGSICQRTIRVAWMPCYDHFGQPVQMNDEVR
ncbi:hypothetical protein SAMN04487948_11041 [Halogranum amylolyticum]|uniref:Uncharacterized protein n=1 Tax=Halogranum amylolyticum TaxID=660520 RepID=A0A1H8UAV1_9EURY|nr:hypothetical protein SAMN04487948_11041 [Halogranum amylolyticum]